MVLNETILYVLKGIVHMLFNKGSYMGLYISELAPGLCILCTAQLYMLALYLMWMLPSYVFPFVTDWDREKLLEDWMCSPENCCQRSGVQMPTPPPSGYNAWDTLPSPRTPRTTRSSVTSPDEISLSPGDIDMALVSFISWGGRGLPFTYSILCD